MMGNEHIWEKIIGELRLTPAEIHTVPKNKREPLWFKAYIEKEDLYVWNAEHHKPSTSMGSPRKITKKDFLKVYEAHNLWEKEKEGTFLDVRKLSMNSAYIFALISRYE